MSLADLEQGFSHEHVEKIWIVSMAFVPRNVLSNF
jgi:hypothetical protein